MAAPTRLQSQINEKKPTSLGNMAVFAALVVLLIGVLFYLKRNSLNLKLDNAAAIPTDGSISPAEVDADIEFARKVQISICNFSFTNLQSYLETNNRYFIQKKGSGGLDDFQTNFFTDELQKKIISGKIYCTEENLEAQQTNVKGNQVGIWFSGTLVYASAATVPASIIRVPFSDRMLIQNTSDGLKVVDFEFVNSQKTQTF